MNPYGKNTKFTKHTHKVHQEKKRCVPSVSPSWPLCLEIIYGQNGKTEYVIFFYDY